MSTTSRIALARLGMLPSTPGTPTPERATAALAELASVGITLTNPELIGDDFIDSVPEVIEQALKLKGSYGTYTPLFDGFPNNLPQWDNFTLRRTLAASRFLEHVITDLAEDPTLELTEDSLLTYQLDDDTLREILDFSDIGWWPASSVPQDIDKTLLQRAAQELLPQDRVSQPTVIELVEPQELEKRVNAWRDAALASPVSLREDVRDDVALLLEENGTEGINVASVPFRETRALIHAVGWKQNPESLVGQGLTPNDLLRLLADTAGASVLEKKKYPKLNRKQRRAIVGILEDTPRLTELYNDRGLWLALLKGLHLGEYKAPKLSEAAAALRTRKTDPKGIDVRVEKALSEGKTEEALEILATEAPGGLGRQLRRFASLTESDAQAWQSFKNAVAVSSEAMSLPVLLSALAQFKDNGDTYPRVAFTKDGSMKNISRRPGHLALQPQHADEIQALLEAAIHNQLALLPSWEGQKVHVDEDLSEMLMPTSLRATSQGSIQVERGSKLPLGDSSVLRLFVHWKEPEDSRSDLDLSCLVLDENYNTIKQVSWTNLTGDGMVHSGDLTSAPEGAEEFIDVDLKHLKASGYKYVAPSVLRFAGPAFKGLEEANVGWMLREDASSDIRTFDPATVVNAFDLGTGKGTVAVPFVADLQSGQVLYVDAYINSAWSARVERDNASITQAIKAVSERSKFTTSILDLVKLHVEARGGELVANVEDATITFGTGPTVTFDMLRPEPMIAELLGKAEEQDDLAVDQVAELTADEVPAVQEPETKVKATWRRPSTRDGQGR